MAMMMTSLSSYEAVDEAYEEADDIFIMTSSSLSMTMTVKVIATSLSSDEIYDEAAENDNDDDEAGDRDVHVLTKNLITQKKMRTQKKLITQKKQINQGEQMSNKMTVKIKMKKIKMEMLTFSLRT